MQVGNPKSLLELHWRKMTYYLSDMYSMMGVRQGSSHYRRLLRFAVISVIDIGLWSPHTLHDLCGFHYIDLQNLSVDKQLGDIMLWVWPAVISDQSDYGLFEKLWFKGTIMVLFHLLARVSYLNVSIMLRIVDRFTISGNPKFLGN